MQTCDLCPSSADSAEAAPLSSPDAPLLSRAFIETGSLKASFAREAPNLRLLSDAERAASLRMTLDTRPPGSIWLFAYGSLIWNPTIRSAEQCIARIEGWHRTFCLSTIAGRGSVDRPGLVLALDAGGTCQGVAYRLAETEAESELALLWRREMVTAAYIPRWIDIFDEQDNAFGKAIAFTINPASPHYARNLETSATVHRLATGVGSLGSSAEYLFRTRDGLRTCGIPDPELEQLAAEVEAAITAKALHENESL
ncbi:MAG: gamma-glutamylcyclotransferase [Parvibaculaceae bacterium]|nr:gamma-glutamylcyclotransferase [Parvibaculaceae bacterium]